MDGSSKRKYIIETKEPVLKRNEISPKHIVNKKKIYNEDEVKELLKQLMEDKENESNI